MGASEHDPGPSSTRTQAAPPSSSCSCCGDGAAPGRGHRGQRRRQRQWLPHGFVLLGLGLALLHGATLALAWLQPPPPPPPQPHRRAGLRLQASGGGSSDSSSGPSSEKKSSSSGLLSRPKVLPRVDLPSSLPLRRPPRPSTPSPPPVAEHFHDSILDADVGAMLQQQLARLRGNRNGTEPGGAGEEGKGAFGWWGDLVGFVTRRGEQDKEQQPPSQQQQQQKQPQAAASKGKGNKDPVANAQKQQKEEEKRRQREQRKREEEAAKEAARAARESRREKAAEGIKSTARAIAEGWQSVDWSGLASRVKGSGKDALSAMRARLGRGEGGDGSEKRQQRQQAPLPPSKPQAPPRGFASWPSMGAGGASGGKPFLPSLLQRIDPSAYTSSMWNSMMGRGNATSPSATPLVDAPRSFDELVKLPQTAGEAWDLFVDDTRSFFDAIYKTVAVPRAALPERGPQRPVLGAQRPKAARVRQGPLNAAPLVLREKQQGQEQQGQEQQGQGPGHDWRGEEERGAAEERRKRAAATEKERAERMSRSSAAAGMEEEEEDEERKKVREEERWEAIRGRVQDMLQGQQQQAQAEAAAAVAGLLGAGRASEGGQGKEERRGRGGPYRWLAKLPKPLKAPRLVDRLEERPRGIAASMGVGASSNPPALEYAPPPEEGTASFAVTEQPALPPFPQLRFRQPDGWGDNDEGRAEEEEGRRWKRPAWLDNLSLTKALTRKPSPERLQFIIRRRQAVRRMPRKMDDNFLRTVSRKLGGNRLRIREFQLATDRYRNSLLDAPAYYDAVVGLFGSSRDAEEVLLPLMSLLPEASKRRGLLDEYRARQRRQQLAAAGLAADAGARDVGAAVGGWLAGAGQAMGGLFSAGARAVGGAARAVVAGVQSGASMIELSFETEDYAQRQQLQDALSGGRGPSSSSSSSPPPPPTTPVGGAREGIDSGTAAALLGLEAELSRNRFLDAPLQRIAALLGANADPFSVRLDQYRRGAIQGIDLYQTMRRLCGGASAGEARLDAVVAELRKEALIPDGKWANKVHKLEKLFAIHEGQRRSRL